jgi:hypothetical protein
MRARVLVAGSLSPSARREDDVCRTRRGRSIDGEAWHALDQLGKDCVQNFQELADEAFADLRANHGRATKLKTAAPKRRRDLSPGRRAEVRRRRQPSEGQRNTPTSAAPAPPMRQQRQQPLAGGGKIAASIHPITRDVPCLRGNRTNRPAAHTACRGISCRINLH